MGTNQGAFVVSDLGDELEYDVVRGDSLSKGLGYGCRLHICCGEDDDEFNGDDEVVMVMMMMMMVIVGKMVDEECDEGNGWGVSGGGVWSDIVKIRGEIDGLGVDFTSSCVEIGGRRLVCWKEGLGMVMGGFENGIGDRRSWSLGEDGEFTVKELSRLIEEKILMSANGDQETLWNKLVPKKVNIFVWRPLRGRLSVRVELDRRGLDLDSVLCPSCNNVVETCAHCLITCDLAMSVWDKIFKWWKVGIVNTYTI
ncbi:RNA-directed DNA polymerase, eukaryota, reverse transcriptase zinc-binding domain protein [Tanacetum coccineum]